MIEETLEIDPITGKYMHMVRGDYSDVAKENHQAIQAGEHGFVLGAEAKEKYSIPTVLMYDPIVREFLQNPNDKLLERLVVAKYPEIVSSKKGPRTDRVFFGGAKDAT